MIPLMFSVLAISLEAGRQGVLLNMELKAVNTSTGNTILVLNKEFKVQKLSD